MNGRPDMKTCIRFALIMLTLAVATAQAGAPYTGDVYLSQINGQTFRVQLAYDGTNAPSISTPQVVATLVRGGGARVGPHRQLYVVGAGNISQVDLASGVVTLRSTFSNANAISLDPDGVRAWTGWFDTTLSEQPLSPFDNGVPRAVTGSDTTITTLAFTPSNGVFFANGNASSPANFGRIELSTFTTSRISSGIYATGVVYDPFSQRLLLAGVGRLRQIDPANPAVAGASRDDSAAGENYLVLEPSGKGHAIGTRYGAVARLVLLDYSTSGNIAGAGTQLFSVPLPGVTDLSGAAGVDLDSLFADGFE